MSTDDTQGIADAAQGPDSPPDIQATDSPAPAEVTGSDLHETLLEGVSPEAIAAHGAGEVGAGEVGAGEHVGGEPEAVQPDGPVDADTTEPEPAPETASLAEDLTVVPDEAAEPVPFATEAVEAANTVAETVAESIPVSLPVPVALPDPRAARETVPPGTRRLSGLRTFAPLAASPRLGQVMGELREANATVLTYLRGEGAAALAHWQALSGAKTPADAIRLQVDEMQRAADASLSCFAALAKRAGRFTALIGRP